MSITEKIQNGAVAACGVAGLALSEMTLPGSSAVIHWLAGITIAAIAQIGIRCLSNPAPNLSGTDPETPNSSDTGGLATGAIHAVSWGWWLFQSLPYAVQSAALAATAIYGWQKWKEWSVQKSEASSSGAGTVGRETKIVMNFYINGQEKAVSPVIQVKEQAAASCA